MKWISCLFIFGSIICLTAKNEEAIAKKTTFSNQQILVEQTNLALRQVGHQLLLLAGNDTATIAPVQQQKGQIFLLPIAQSFNYDTLPFLLDAALTNLEINQELYHVTVKDCQADTIILGYDVRQFQAGNVPCIGRTQYADCNHIYVTFPNRRPASSAATFNWLYIWLLPIFLGIIFYVIKSRKAPPSKPVSIKNMASPTIATNQLISIGQSQLDVANQLVYIHNEPITLTFRETKLLHYFVNHSGQLLKREELLENVWEEEGVIVGRSLDVFVSRLRKILKGDDSLVIKTVHGVGYRLEEVKHFS